MTPRRPRASIGTMRVAGDCPRVSYGTVDAGDLEVVSLRVVSKTEEAQCLDYIRQVMPLLAGPRTLTRRRQIVDHVVHLAYIVGTPLDATEVANLHAWARSVQR